MRADLSFWGTAVVLAVVVAPLVAEARAPWPDHAPWPYHAPWDYHDEHHPGYFYQGDGVTGEFQNGQPVCLSNGRHGHHRRAEDEQAACEAARQQWITDHSRRASIYHR